MTSPPNYAQMALQILEDASEYRPGTSVRAARVAEAQVYATLAGGASADLIQALSDQVRQARAREFDALKRLERAERMAAEFRERAARMLDDAAAPSAAEAVQALPLIPTTTTGDPDHG